MAEKQQKGYWGVLPASVRYDKRICANAKLLFTELTALTNETGYCWATNEYFAELYGVHKKSISRWFQELAAAGYIKIEIEDGRNGYQRKVYLTEEAVRARQIGGKQTEETIDRGSPQNCGEGLHETVDTSPQNCGGGLHETVDRSPQNCGQNITVNTTVKNTGKEARPLRLDSVIDYFVEQGCERVIAEKEGVKFWNHFSANGWKVGGKAPMKDWRAAVRQWIMRMHEFQANVGVVDYRKRVEELEMQKFLSSKG